MSGGPLAEGAVLQDRFRLQRRLGTGGVAEAWLADDSETGRRCVVKQLRLRAARGPHDDAAAGWKTVELFERESRVLARLDHPRIPRHVAWFTTDDDGGGRRLFLVESFVEGRTLAQAVADGRRLTERAIVDFAIEVAEVLRYLHGLRPAVIHRDLKPSNLVVDDGGDTARLRLGAVIDFGAVREQVRLDKQRAGETIAGTFGYMPPEQLEGKAVPASDLYALGAIMVFALSHADPAGMQGDDLRIRFRDRVQASEGLVHVLDRLLALDPRDRYRTADELLADLRAVSSGREPARARGARAAAPALFHRRAVRLAALVVLLVAAAGRIGSSGRRVWSTRGAVDLLAFAPDGGTLAAASRQDGSLSIWDTRSWRRRWGVGGEPRAALAFSPDGRTLAVATTSYDQTLKARRAPVVELLDATTGARRRMFFAPPGSNVDSLAFAPDGRTLAVAANGRHPKQFYPVGGSILMFATADAGARPPRDIRRNGQPVFSLAFLPDGRLVFTSLVFDPGRTRYASDEIVILDLASGAETVRRLGLGGTIGSTILPSRDGTRLAWSDGSAESATVLDPSLRPRLTLGARSRSYAHRAFVEGAFTPDGRGFSFPDTELTWVPWDKLPFGKPWSNQHRFVRLWDTASGRERDSFRVAQRGANGTVQALAVSPDGRWLAAGFGTDFEGGLKVWRIDP